MQKPQFPRFGSIGLRSKFVLLVSFLLVLLFGLFATFLIRSNTDTLRDNLYNEAKAFAVLSTEPIGNTFAIYKDSGTSKIDQSVREASSLNDSIVNVAIVNVDGERLYQQFSESAVAVSKTEAASFDPIYRENDKGVIDSIVYPYFEASGVHRFSVVYSVSDVQIEQTIARNTMSSLAFAIFALLVTGVSIYLLINLLIIRPIESLSRQASIISAGKLDQQINIRSRDEIGRLSNSVNRMADSLKQHIAKLEEIDKVKSEFMMITSHNLRTPLTIITGYMENADIYSKNPEMMAKIINKISASVQRLEMFAEDVLMISRFELGEQDLSSERIDIKPFLEELSDDFAPSVESKGVSFKLNVEAENAAVEASPPHIRSAIWNLLDNALKFTKQGEINLACKVAGDKLHISVTDTGLGISQEEMPKLFTKFHRGTSTLTYNYGGTGIGLYASKVMIQNYGGTITAKSELGKGSTFTIELPLAVAKDKGSTEDEK